jgi:hypothetical protein
VLDAFRAFLPRFLWLTPNLERFNAGSDELEGDEELDETVWSSADTTINYQPARPDNARRLSRELEEGFRDSSDDEDGG